VSLRPPNTPFRSSQVLELQAMLEEWIIAFESKAASDCRSRSTSIDCELGNVEGLVSDILDWQNGHETIHEEIKEALADLTHTASLHGRNANEDRARLELAEQRMKSVCDAVETYASAMAGHETTVKELLEKGLLHTKSQWSFRQSLMAVETRMNDLESRLEKLNKECIKFSAPPSTREP
jgi:hypothetical protein